MVNPDAPQEEKLEKKKEVRHRQRASTSCTECRRRKQKCNQTKDRPCNNCSRRYPPVPCVYELFKKATKHKGVVVELNVPEPKLGEVKTEVSGRPVLGTLHEETALHGTTAFSTSRHKSWQIPIRSPSNWQEGYRELGKDLEPPDPGDQIFQNLPPVSDISSFFPVGRFCSHPQLFHPQYADPQVPTEVDINPLVSLPIEPSRRNAELFHFFIYRLAPFMCSIDGNNSPAKFMREWVPFMIQSPIVVYIALLTTSYYQAASRQIKVEDSVDAMAAKGRLISLINTHIRTHSKGGVDDESIAAVMSLSYNELVYSDERSTLAHMHGLREMVKTRGGVQHIKFPLLRKMLMRTDFQIACTLECPLFLHADEVSPLIRPLSIYPPHLDCPFLLSPIRFVDKLNIHKIAPETAQMLDDVRWLITSVIYLPPSNSDTEQATSSPPHQKLLATAQWISNRLSSHPPIISPSTPHQLAIHNTLLLTTQILLSSLLSRQPLSQSLTTPLFWRIWQCLWSVPLPVWKLHPGLFFYVLLVVNPGARGRPEGRILKAMLAATAIAIGIYEGDEREGNGWDVLKGVVGSVVRVQGWLSSGSSSFREEG